jgi:hypothetical protein
MTVTNSSSKQSAQAMNGVATVFAFSFEALTDISQLSGIKAAILNTVTNVQTDLIYNDGGSLGYTVSVNANGVGGSITVNDSQTTDYTITIYREYDELQETNYADYNAFPSETVEDNQDLLTFIAQQQSEVTSRSIVLPITTTGVSVELPPPVADAFLGWDSLGTSLVNLPDPTIAADAAAAAAAASAAAALVSETNAAVSETNAAASAAAAAADVVLTNADVVSTNADVVSSGNNVQYAEDWAITPEDTLVPAAAGGNQVDEYSALHWANKSAASAANSVLPILPAAADQNVQTASDGLSYVLAPLGTSTAVDDFTIINNLGTLEAIVVNRMGILALGDLNTDYLDGVADTYTDQTGIDLGASADQVFEGGSYRTPIATVANPEALKVLFNEDGGTTDITDSSGQAHVVTKNGNATLSPNHYKFGNGSLYCNTANTQFLNVAYSTDFDIFASAATSHTVDFWVKHIDAIAVASEAYVTMGRTPGGANQLYSIYKTVGDDALTLLVRNAGADVVNMKGGFITDNEWHHVVYSKIADVHSFWIDGYQTAYVQDASTMVITPTDDLRIGAWPNGSSNILNGWLDDVRITDNNAFFAAPIPQPLCHFTMDDNAASNAVTNYGSNGSAGGYSGGNTETKHSSGKVRYSLDFVAASSNYININTAMASTFTDTTGTIMFWMNPKTASNGNVFAWGNTTNANARMGIQHDSGGWMNHIIRSAGVNVVSNQSTTNPPLGVWTHVAVVQDGVQFKWYFNGVAEDGTQSVGAGTEWVSTASSPAINTCTIGAVFVPGALSFYNGRLDDVRYYQTDLSATEIESIRVAGVAGYYGLGSPNITVPTAAHTDDPNTLLLLPFDTTTQGNDLLDISANGAGRFATSVNGAGVTGKFGNAFVSFDGTGDYLSVADAASLDFGTGTFSGDLWFRKGVTGTQMMLLNKRDGAANNEINLINQTSDLLSFATYNSSGGGANVIANSATGLAVDNDWHHIYFQRNSGDLALYLDGTQIAFAAGASEDVSSTGDLIYGANDTPAIYFHGDMDGMQISDIVRFSATPIAQPYIAYGCNDNAANQTVVNTGTGANNGATQPGNTDARNVNPGHIGDALSFNGTTEYLSANADVATINSDTTGAVSAWIFVDTVAASRVIYSLANTAAQTRIQFFVGTGQQLRVFIQNTGTSLADYESPGSSIPLSTWTHVVLSQDGVVPKLFINSVEQSLTVNTAVDPTAWNATLTSPNVLYYGAINFNGGGAQLFFDGNLDDLRYYQHSLSQAQIDQIYNSGTGTESFAVDTITVPTTETVADANSVLLLNCNTLDLSDNKHIVEFEGGMAINTNFAPLSDLRGSLNLVAANSQALTLPDSPDWDVFGATTQDYTIDVWLRSRINPSTKQQDIVGQIESGTESWFFRHRGNFGNDFIVTLVSGGTSYNVCITNGSFLSQNVWSHVAMVKVGGASSAEYAVYVDGVQIGYGTSSQTDTFNAGVYGSLLRIGTGWNGAPEREFDGYMSDLRITDNNAFSATPFNQPDIQLRLNETSGTIADVTGVSDGTDYTITGGSNASVMTTAGKINTAYTFDGAADYLFATNGGTYNSNTTGTITAWVNPANFSTTSTIMAFADDSAVSFAAFSITTGGLLEIRIENVATPQMTATSVASISTSVWTHVAIVQNGVAPTVYINGVSEVLIPSLGGAEWFSVAGPMDISSVGALRRNASVINYFAGDLDDVRYYANTILTQDNIDDIFNSTNGTEELFANTLTVPTTKHVADGNTVLLAAFEPGITGGVPVDLLDSSSSGHILTPLNGAHVTGAFNEGSTPGYATFDGTQNIKIAGHSDFEWLEDPKQDETIHFWVRHESDPTGTSQQYFYYANVAATLRFILQHSSSNVTRLVINTQNGGTQLIDGLAISDTLWHHIAIIGIGNEGDSGSGQSTGKSWQGYLDGTQILQGFQNGHDVATIDDDLYIGSNRTGGTFFTGDMDAFIVQHDNTIFNASYALTGDSITVPIAEPAGITTPGIMTLQSVTTTALASPDTIKIYFDLEDLDPTVVLNTDIIVGVQRNTTDAFLQIATLTFSVTGGTHPRHIIEATVDMTVDQGSGVPAAGTDIYYQVQTANDRQLRLHSVTMLWD